ncbi:hypothetical protein EAI30_00285 [Romboutsia ilealis]|uniref:HAD-IA family hydrolase n=1 Tax=Romboutsia faecis TaxID=2764597 RepID=A0ABR7JLN8_9FIRM|nr:HAD-IA family hydrolase [Romboutsia faecis]MBC5995844.1 HAD-IA family hydrolase [Romboutsia faecis]MRN23043.1 hypothetical protein [Romboutsia ilealis]
MINENIEYIFLDYFDTIVHRTVPPEYIKKIWSKQINLRLGIEKNSEWIYNLREECAEKISNDNSKNDFDREYKYEQLIKQMYNRLIVHDLLSSDMVSYDDFYHICLDTEIEIEKEHQVINLDIVNIIKKYSNSGYKIYCISDFYLPKVAMQAFLKYHEIDIYFENVYISSEYLVQKSTGKLYEIVIEDLNINPENAIMIGDNYNSDNLMAKLKGLNSHYVDRTSMHKSYDKAWKQRNDSKYVIKQLDKIYKSSKKNLQPFACYGIYYYLFAERLYKILMKNGVNDVFFLSREGEMLKRIFDKYQELKPESFKRINTHYLLVSRASTFLSQLEPIEEETFCRLFDQYSTLNISNFLYSLTFNKDEIQTILNDINLDGEVLIENFRESKEFSKLKESNVFIDLYNLKRREQKLGLQEYIKSFGVDVYKDGMNIVDVGWKGSMQGNLYKFFEEKVKLKGFYLGVIEDTNMSSDNMKYGLVFSAMPCKSICYKELAMEYWFHEDLLHPSHGRASSYKLKENGYVEVICEHEPEVVKLYNDVVKYIHKDILEVIQMMDCVFKGHWEVNEFITYIAYLNYKENYTRNEQEKIVERLLSKNHYSSFGMDNVEMLLQNEATPNKFKKYKNIVQKGIKFIVNIKPHVKLPPYINSLIIRRFRKTYIYMTC